MEEKELNIEEKRLMVYSFYVWQHEKYYVILGLIKMISYC